MSASTFPAGIESTLVEFHRIPSCADLFAHGCNVQQESEGKVRITWPKGTILDPAMDQYTLPSGYTVLLRPKKAG